MPEQRSTSVASGPMYAQRQTPAPGTALEAVFSTTNGVVTGYSPSYRLWTPATRLHANFWRQGGTSHIILQVTLAGRFIGSLNDLTPEAAYGSWDVAGNVGDQILIEVNANGGDATDLVVQVLYEA